MLPRCYLARAYGECVIAMLHGPTVVAVLVAGVAVSLLAAGCGAGAPGVASVASSTTTAAATTQSGSDVAGAAAGGGSSAGQHHGSGSGNSTVIDFGNAAETAKFSACIRKHGIPSFPDPNSHGAIQFGPAFGIDPRSPKFRSAASACLKLLPNGGQPTQRQQAQTERQWLAFSRCMRAHGITDFPDPSNGRPPNIQAGGGLNPNDRRFRTAETVCKRHLAGVLGGDKFLTG